MKKIVLFLDMLNSTGKSCSRSGTKFGLFTPGDRFESIAVTATATNSCE